MIGPEFRIMLFYGVYVLERVGYTQTHDYIYASFEVKRSKMPFECVDPEVRDRVPTILEVYNMLATDYLAEFLMSLGVNHYYIPGTKEVQLNVLQNDDTEVDEAYITLQAKYSFEPSMPVYCDTLLSGEPVTQVLPLGNGIQGVFTNQTFTSVTQPYIMKHIEIAAPNKHGKIEFPGWTSRMLDFVQIYEGYIKPLIYGMVGSFLDFDNSYRDIRDITKYEDYYKASIIFNIQYDRHTFHCAIHCIPCQVLGHYIRWWAGDSPFHIQVSTEPAQNAKYGVNLNEDEMRLVLGTTWASLYPINLENIQHTWTEGHDMIILDLLESSEIESSPDHCSTNLIGLPRKFHTNVDRQNITEPINTDKYNEKRQFNLSNKDGLMTSVMVDVTPFIFTIDNLLLAACTPFRNYDSCGGYITLRFDQDIPPDQMRIPMADEEVKATFPRLHSMIASAFDLDEKRLMIILIPFVTLPRTRKYLIWFNYKGSMRKTEEPKEQEGIIPKESTPKKKNPTKKKGFFGSISKGINKH